MMYSCLHFSVTNRIKHITVLYEGVMMENQCNHVTPPQVSYFITFITSVFLRHNREKQLWLAEMNANM